MAAGTGFDIGNDSCVFAVARPDGVVHVLTSFPAAVRSSNNRHFFGAAAAASPHNTVTQIKRLLGRKFSDPDLQRDLRSLSFTITEGPDGFPLIQYEEAGDVCGIVERSRGEGNGLNGNVSSEATAGDRGSPTRDVEKGERESELEYLSETESPEEGEWRGPRRRSGLRCGLTDNPGFGILTAAPLIFYGLQHYLSLAGWLVFIPLIMVPVMGGTDEETATVISTMLLVSGLTTILHSFFGTRLPLVQGSSFVYLAPALVIINSEEFHNLSENVNGLQKFEHIMRELQGAIIVGSVFQRVLGYSGLMSLLLRLINPVVVAPTVAAVGLAFFSYGFPQAGTCLGISIPQMILVLNFTLVVAVEVGVFVSELVEGVRDGVRGRWGGGEVQGDEDNEVN